MAPAASVFFDITTSAQWMGRPTGIVRTERELARRAVALLGNRLRFCVWSHSETRFYGLDHETAGAILAGDLKIDVNPVAQEAPLPTTARTSLRARLSGRRQAPPPSKPAPQLHALSTGPLTPGFGTTVFSAGLDWDYKDLRHIRALKRVNGFRYVVVLYDLIGLTHPHFVAPANRLRLADYFGELFWTADRLLPISADTESAARNWCSSNRLSMELARFEPGSDIPAVPAALPPALAGKTFALCVGTIEPRKNHRLLYDAWRIALARGDLDTSHHRLVFAGSTGWNTGDLMDEIGANPLTRHTILHIENASDGEIAGLYDAASVCLIPSHLEGYGLPLAEALRAGAPCLSSPAGALKEIRSSAVTWLDPDDPQSWSLAIPPMLRTLPARFPALTPRSWDDAARDAFAAAGLLA